MIIDRSVQYRVLVLLTSRTVSQSRTLRLTDLQEIDPGMGYTCTLENAMNLLLLTELIVYCHYIPV